MAQKRKVTHDDPSRSTPPSSQVHATRQTLITQPTSWNPPTGARQPFQPRKKARHLNPGEQVTHTISSLHKAIRDVNRRLTLPSLPADIKAEDEKSLKDMESELRRLEAGKERRKMVSRYHMVRFFERQKATRALKKSVKQLENYNANASARPDDVESAEGEMTKEELIKIVHDAEVDLNYTMYYPLAEAYVGILPGKREGKENGKGKEKEKEKEKEKQDKKAKKDKTQDDKKQGSPPKPPMWFIVEAAMASGTLEALRDRPPMNFTFRPRTKSKNADADSHKRDVDSLDSRKEEKQRPAHDKRKEDVIVDVDADADALEEKGYASGGGFFDE